MAPIVATQLVLKAFRWVAPGVIPLRFGGSPQRAPYELWSKLLVYSPVAL